jgi:hypothetical protein
MKNIFTYDNPGAHLEGMGFGPNNHFWVSGWDKGTIYELGGGRLQQWIGEKAYRYYVDDEAPVITKEYEGLDCYKYVPKGGDEMVRMMHYVSSKTKIHLNVTDPGEPCASGVQGMWYKIWWNGTWYPGNDTTPVPYGGNDEFIWCHALEEWWFNYIGPISFTEECIHYIEYMAKDYVCHHTQIFNQTYFVDNTPPVTTKTYGELSGECDVYWADCLTNGVMWVESDTFIYLEADEFGCEGGVQSYRIFWRIWFNGSYTPWYNGAINQDVEFNMYGWEAHLFVTEKGDWCFNESYHVLEYYAIDCVGNMERMTIQPFYVDNAVPDPEITEPVGLPHNSPDDLWYYRPGHDINMNYTESTLDEICAYEWWFSIDGVKWILIEREKGDGKNVIWETGKFKEILEPAFCSNGSRDVWVKLKIWDEHCRNNTDITLVRFCRELNPRPCVQEILIQRGWNLISIAVDLDSLGNDYTASILAAEINSQAGENIVKYIVRWNKTTHKFNEYVVDSDIGWDFPINKGEGYYVYSLSPFDVVFTIVGDCPACEYIDLEVCWNLIGWDSIYEGMTAREFAALINDAAGFDVVQAIVKHDPTEDPEYIAWYPGDEWVNNFKLELNHAYWVFVSVPVNNVMLPGALPGY